MHAKIIVWCRKIAMDDFRGAGGFCDLWKMDTLTDFSAIFSKGGHLSDFPFASDIKQTPLNKGAKTLFYSYLSCKYICSPVFTGAFQWT